jgi:hypothetical protein
VVGKEPSQLGYQHACSDVVNEFRDTGLLIPALRKLVSLSQIKDQRPQVVYSMQLPDEF